MNVGEYLSLKRPAWDWRNLDCCRWIDRWIVACGYPSPMEAIGIDYDSEISAMRLIARGGGLLRLWTDGLKITGIPEVDEPQAGDFAVILRPTQCGADEAMAIFTGTRWATLGVRGIDFAPAEALRIWRP